AWAALQSAANLERAQRDRDTAHALLGLARDLAVVGSSSEVAHRIVTAVMPVCGSSAASVWLWDETEDCLRLVEAIPERSLPQELTTLPLSSVPELVRMIASPEPQVVDR